MRVLTAGSKQDEHEKKKTRFVRILAIVKIAHKIAIDTRRKETVA